MERLRVQMSGSEHFDGYTLTVLPKKAEKRYKNPGSVAKHEGWHMAKDPKNVRRGSKNSGPGYLGITELYRFDAGAAVAPHVHGMSGTGHDLGIVYLSGVSFSAAASAAGGIKEEHAFAIASRLEAVGEMSGTETEEVVDEVENGKDIVAVLEGPGGEKEETEGKLPWNTEIVLVDFRKNRSLELSKAA